MHWYVRQWISTLGSRTILSETRQSLVWSFLYYTKTYEEFAYSLHCEHWYKCCCLHRNEEKGNSEMAGIWLTDMELFNEHCLIDTQLALHSTQANTYRSPWSCFVFSHRCQTAQLNLGQRFANRFKSKYHLQPPAEPRKDIPVASR